MATVRLDLDAAGYLATLAEIRRETQQSLAAVATAPAIPLPTLAGIANPLGQLRANVANPLPGAFGYGPEAVAAQKKALADIAAEQKRVQEQVFGRQVLDSNGGILAKPANVVIQDQANQAAAERRHLISTQDYIAATGRARESIGVLAGVTAQGASAEESLTVSRTTLAGQLRAETALLAQSNAARAAETAARERALALVQAEPVIRGLQAIGGVQGIPGAAAEPYPTITERRGLFTTLRAQAQAEAAQTRSLFDEIGRQSSGTNSEAIFGALGAVPASPYAAQLRALNQRQLQVGNLAVQNAIQNIQAQSQVTALNRTLGSRLRTFLFGGPRGGAPVVPGAPGGPDEPGAPGGGGGGLFGGAGGFGRAFRTTLRYGAASALIFGSVRAVSETIREAKELETQFTILDSQLSAIGQRDRLSELKQSVFDIARGTGLATTEVADLAHAFVGAFQAFGASGIDPAKQATELASQIAVVANLAPAEIFNDLTAGMKAFADGPTAENQVDSLRQLGDVAIDVRNSTGVASKEIIDFLGRIGPIAKQTGLSLNETAAIGGALLQGSAVGGAALAEQFGRILTEFSTSAVEIARVAEAVPQLGISLSEAVAGDPSIIIKLAENFQKLSDAQQRTIIQTIGSRREGATLATILKNSVTLTNALTSAENSRGRVATELEKKQRTLALQVNEMKAAFQQFGLALYEAGLGDFLKEMATAGKSVADVFLAISKILTILPDQVLSFGVKLAAVVAIAKGLSLAGGALGLGAAASGGGLLGRLFAGRAAAAVATEAIPGIAGGVAGSAATAGGGGLLSALGGPVGISIGAGLLLLPTLSKLIKGKKGPTSQLEEQIRAYSEANKDYAQFSSGQIESLIDDVRRSPDVTDKQDIKDLVDALREKNNEKSDARNLEAQAKSAKGKEAQAKRDLATLQALQELHIATAKAAEILAQGLEGKLNEGGAHTLYRDKGIDRNDAISPEQVRKLLSGQDVDLDRGIKRLLEGAGLDLSRLKDPKYAKQVRAAIDRILNGQTEEKEVLTAQAQAVADVEAALQAFDAGTLSLSALSREVARDTEVLSAAAARGDKQAAQDLDKETKEFNKRFDDAIAASTDIRIKIREAMKGDDPAAEIDDLLQQLRSTKLPENRAAIATKIAELTRELKDHRIPKEAQVALVEAQLQDVGGAFQAFVGQFLSNGQQLSDAMLQEMAVLIQAGVAAGKALKTVVLKRLIVLRAQAILLAAFGGVSADVLNEISDLQAIVENTPDAVDFGIAIPRVSVPKDNGKKAADDAKKLAEARLDYQLALVENDPVKAAQIAQQKADLAAQQAETEAERVEAAAARVRADRQLQDAIVAIIDSQFDLAIAYADAAGDTVKSAQLAADKAHADLYALIASGAGEAAINQQKAAVITADANVQKALIQDRIDDFQFLVDIGQRTTAQFVAFLTTLLEDPTLIEEQRRDIQRQIYQLKKTLGQDYQFNLPTELGLPTLYEARRLNQTGGSSGYQDNRQIQIVVQGAGDAETVANRVVDKLNAPSRFGVSPRIY